MGFRSEPNIRWDGVVDELGPVLLRYFLASGFVRSQASDGVQETLLRLFRLAAEGEYDPARGSPRMLAFGIARLVKHEFYRSVNEHELLGVSKTYENRLTDPGGQSALDENEAHVNLRAAIGALENPVREIFLLLIDQELALDEIGALLSIPHGTVKSHIHRGKEKLKVLLGMEKVKV